jgi:hypothetical protein
MRSFSVWFVALAATAARASDPINVGQVSARDATNDDLEPNETTH